MPRPVQDIVDEIVTAMAAETERGLE